MIGTKTIIVCWRAFRRLVWSNHCMPVLRFPARRGDSEARDQIQRTTQDQAASQTSLSGFFSSSRFAMWYMNRGTCPKIAVSFILSIFALLVCRISPCVLELHELCSRLRVKLFFVFPVKRFDRLALNWRISFLIGSIMSFQVLCSKGTLNRSARARSLCLQARALHDIDASRGTPERETISGFFNVVDEAFGKLGWLCHQKDSCAGSIYCIAGLDTAL